MDDERLLAEALRAHAAGGVSVPGGTPSEEGERPPASGPADPGSGAEAAPTGSRLRDRFRPLGRGKKGDTAETAEAPEGITETTPRPDPRPGPAPGPLRTAGPPGPGSPYTPTGRGPAAPPRPGPRPAPGPGTPERPWPQAGPRPPARPVPPTGPVARPGAPHVPHPRPATGGTGASRTAPPPAPGDGPRPWTGARIAWWSGVALLAGAVAGALAAVGTLGLPG
ncbi:hypothetical protein GCM10023200_02330 [Actinomycetospora chlora]|uniref:Translation initiation factor IF-2 n=1 Tax=Actinomycetospora chlora TaxID=663608 RepID=A0ABP9A5L4_9PSEU